MAESNATAGGGEEGVIVNQQDSIGDQKCSLRETVVGECAINESDAIGQDEQMTMAEKLMLEFLLEKESQSLRSNTSTLDQSQFARSSRSTVEKMPLLPGEEKESEGDRSVMKAIDQLDQISDDQLTRMLRQCQNEEGDASAGNLLAWWMTQSQLDRPAGKEKAGRSMAGQRRRALESAYSSRSIEPNRNRKGTSSTRPRPMELPNESGRIMFSFMQEDEPATVQETSFMLPDTNDADAIPGANATFSACVQDEMDDGIRRAKKERRRTRRVDEEEDATETREHTDSEHDDGMSAVFEDVLRPKPKKKTTQLVGMLWNPEKPRPMPRRLCKGLQSLTADWYQIGGPSTSGNGQKSNE